jgi:hypothetical protein
MPLALKTKLLSSYFNLNAFETRNRRFVGTAVTDGVDAAGPQDLSFWRRS